ncbi:Hypothetical protein GLP15_3928 [Giardia lamblia P15]|uniref:Uncharacterized protein n=1 Tax=Giardia intestinalis (strain P15) TaxID=658858 RepID=E1F2F9_GIAIA|nr:Hypothetical protein GLP15_3928 [Giardia lamblia P15]
MNPTELRQRRAAPSAPSAASSERLLQRRPRSAVKPEWNDLQQDHSKYRLTEDEIRRRRESRAPRPLTSQPLLGDKHITETRRPSSASRQDRKTSSVSGGSGTQASQVLHASQSSPQKAQNLMEYLIDDVEGSLTLKDTGKAPTAPRSPVLNSEDYITNDISKVRKSPYKQTSDPCGHLAVLQAVLQKLNYLTDKVDQLTERQASIEEELRIALEENLELKREVDLLRRDVRHQQEVSTGQEYVSMEEVLERLKLV